MFNARLQTLRNICRRASVPILLGALALFLVFLFDVPVTERVSKDAKLYLWLADGLSRGVGYGEDPDRAVPSIGHPLFLAFLVWLQIPLVTAVTGCLMASLVLVVLAVRIGTGSTLLATACMFGFHGLLRLLYTRYLFIYAPALAEGSLLLFSGLFILALAVFHRRGFAKPAAALAGICLAVYILVRPLFLFPMLGGAALLCAWAVRRMKQEAAGRLNPILAGWATLLAVSSLFVAFVWVYSLAACGDSRMVTGTYGAHALFYANSKFFPTDMPWTPKLMEQLTPELEREWRELNAPGLSAAEKERRYMEAILSYVTEQPGRALRGYVWRLNRYLGIPGRGGVPGRPVSLYALHVWVGLALGAALAGLRVRNARGVRLGVLGAWASSLGVVYLCLWLLWAGIMAFFVFIPIRYLSHGLAFLAAMPYVLLADILQSTFTDGKGSAPCIEANE